MSNFDFLKDFDTILWKLGNRIEKQINISPSGVKADATTFLEHLLKQLRQRYNLGDSTKDFYHRLDELYRSGYIKRDYKIKIYDAYMLRNQIHADLDYIEKTEYVIALQLHKKLYYLAKKYYRESDEYDEYKGVPLYKMPEIDLTDDEIQLLEIPDFTEIIEFKYDYCVICGEPNHSNYSIYCEDCNREINNANNFISIRNSFGKDSTFTKEDLIEYGLHEGYATRLINSLVKNDLFKVKGREITINNLNLESYMIRIDNFIRVGELITQFRDDKITPKEIKQTKEYRQGSFKQYPFYQFYKVINEEIINKFEKDLLTTEDILSSIEYTTISQKDLNRWYKIQLNQYKKNNINKSFKILNNLLIDDYLSLKRKGLSEKEIQKQLNISDEMLEFFPKFRDNFTSELSEIKKYLILKALSENKSRLETIEYAGITQKEYDDIIKYSKFKENEFNQEYERILNQRKETFLSSLINNDLITSCELTKISVDDFYGWYDEAKIDSEFYIKSNKILMEKFLDKRKEGLTKSEASKTIGLNESIVDNWLKRKNKLFDKFKDDNLKVIVNLILEGFKNNKSKMEIGRDIEVSIPKINSYISLGKRGSHLYHELSQYYESEVIPRNLNKFLSEIKNKSLKKSLELSDLTLDELNYYYENCNEFHDEYLSFKIDAYVGEIISGKNHQTSLKRSNISSDEYNQLNEKLNALILQKRMEVVKKEIKNDRTTEIAAKHAGVKFDDIYDWYYKGKSDDDFRKFSEFFHEHYIEPNIRHFNNLVNDNHPIDKILKLLDINFTKKDFEIWQKEGLIKKENIVVNLDIDEEETKNPTKSSSILINDEKDIEELKKEIMRKK